MFTGIIEETGKITTITQNSLTIKCTVVLKDTKIGDSISVNGICLTVTNLTNNSFTADFSNETKTVTTLSELNNNSEVNLERALTLNSRLGGHIVTGHIDSIGKVISIDKTNEFYNFKIELDKNFEKYYTKKGSITINGVSLTIADITENIITIAIIPHTYNNTNLKSLKLNENVNIEFDILAKYVEKNLSTKNNSSITVDFLQRNGFM